MFTTDDLDPIAVRARQAGVETHHVADEVVRRLTSTVTPQAVVGVAAFLDVGLESVLDSVFTEAEGCIALLHEVRDPGNAGTVLRSADAAGAGGVVFSETSVDVYNPKTARASAGSVFHLPDRPRGLDDRDDRADQGERRPRARDGRRGRGRSLSTPTCRAP